MSETQLDTPAIKDVFLTPGDQLVVTPGYPVRLSILADPPTFDSKDLSVRHHELNELMETKMVLEKENKILQRELDRANDEWAELSDGLHLSRTGKLIRWLPQEGLMTWIIGIGAAALWAEVIAFGAVWWWK